MLKSVYAMAVCAALAAAAFVTLPVNASAPAPVEKSDLADATGCELRSWPYYARGCLRDENRNAGRAVKARLVTTDRLREPVSDETIHVPPPAEPVTEARAGHQAGPEGPATWMMSDREVRRYVAAGDFIRRTVR